MADEQVVLAFRLTAARAEERIRQAALDTENIVWSTHAVDQMDRRSIFRQDVLRILRNGYVDQEPEKTPGSEWKCKITLKIKGSRTAGVVTIILLDGKLFLKTVEWEDGL